MVKTLEEYRKAGTVRDLAPNEKEAYFGFLSITYKDNLAASEFNMLKHPRWSIIAGYYAMHDASKLFLARKFGLKLTMPNIHAGVIQCLRELVNRKDILEYLEKAEGEYKEIISLHLAMQQGKDEREKSQYYISEIITPEISIQKASYFLENLVKPYVKIIEEMSR
jgi:hypothetical protein